MSQEQQIPPAPPSQTREELESLYIAWKLGAQLDFGQYIPDTGQLMWTDHATYDEAVEDELEEYWIHLLLYLYDDPDKAGEHVYFRLRKE